MNQILQSTKQSIKVINKNRSIVALIFLLQILFFSVIMFTSSRTLVPAVDKFTEIQAYMDSINATEEDFEDIMASGILGEDPLIMYRNTQQVTTYFWIFAGVFFAAFVLINGVAWYLTNNLTEKKKQGFLVYISKFALSTLVYFILFLVMLTILSRSLLTGSPLWLLFTSLLIALNYFIFIAFTLNKKGVKEIPNAAFTLGIKKPGTLVSTFLINITIKLLLFTLLSFTLELNFWLMAFALILLTFGFVWARIFLNVVVSGIAGDS